MTGEERNWKLYDREFLIGWFLMIKAKGYGLPELNMTEKDIEKNLSGYAIDKKETGTHQPAEFVAEAFAEYMDSPNPRPIARKVGEILKSYLGVYK